MQDKGVDLLKFRMTNCEKYALALMDALFTEEEMAVSCYSATPRSKKPPLPQEKISQLESMYVM